VQLISDIIVTRNVQQTFDLSFYWDIGLETSSPLVTNVYGCKAT